MTTDPTAAIEVLARLLCAADVHVHDGDHPTWQQLRVAQHGRGQDDYRKAARWLLPRMTVATRPAAVPVAAPPVAVDSSEDRCAECGHFRGAHEEAEEPVSVGRCTVCADEDEWHGFEESPVAAPPTTEQTALREQIAAAIYEHMHPGSHWSDTSMPADWRPAYREEADAVLAVLPAPADRAATLREAATRLDGLTQEAAGADMTMPEGRWQAGLDTGIRELRRLAVEAEQAGGPSREATEPQLRCVCGDPVQLMDEDDPTSWIHSPGSDTRCLDARPRCPHCQMPHDLTPSVALACASIRASIAAAAAPAVSSRPGTEQEA